MDNRKMRIARLVVVVLSLLIIVATTKITITFN